MTLQERFKDEVEFYEWLRSRASEMKLLDFMIDDKVFGYTRENLLAHADVLDIPETEEKIADACHIKLARLWLVQRNMVKTKAQVMGLLFTQN